MKKFKVDKTVECVHNPWGVNVDKVIEVTKDLNRLIELRLKSELLPEEYSRSLQEIANVMTAWTRYTTLGSRKETALEEAFQYFYQTLGYLIRTFEVGQVELLPNEARFLAAIAYRGDAYRYLGSGEACDEAVLPEYSDVYVSWTKEISSKYIEQKLSGKKTWMKAVIDGDYFAVDLEGFQDFYNSMFEEEIRITSADEREIVFPTFQECITRTKVFN